LLSPLLKAFTTKNRPPLCGFEGDGGFLAALRACGSGFSLVWNLTGRWRAQHGNSLCLTDFATLGFVLELLIVEEQLFACSKNKVRAAVDTLEYLVLEFHPSPHSPPRSRSFKKARGSPHARVRAESLRTPPQIFKTLDSAHPQIIAGHYIRKYRRNNSGESSTFRKQRDGQKEMGRRRTGAATHSLVNPALCELFCGCACALTPP
jgi:hypothetical protein